jgi:hypothetical protein
LFMEFTSLQAALCDGQIVTGCGPDRLETAGLIMVALRNIVKRHRAHG